jgi:hypothetical protein
VDDDRALERLHDEALELRARLLTGQAVERDAAGADALGDLVGTALVIGVGTTDGRDERDAEDGGENDDELGPQRRRGR